MSRFNTFRQGNPPPITSSEAQLPSCNQISSVNTVFLVRYDVRVDRTRILINQIQHFGLLHPPSAFFRAHYHEMSNYSDSNITRGARSSSTRGAAPRGSCVFENLAKSGPFRPGCCPTTVAWALDAVICFVRRFIACGLY